MNSHIYTFKKECFKQLHGGVIGVSIAGDVANLFMVWWDRELKICLTSEQIVLLLYSRYVDNGNIIVRSNHENSIEEKEIDNEKKEKEIMEKIKVIANSMRVYLLRWIIHQTTRTNAFRFSIRDMDRRDRCLRNAKTSDTLLVLRERNVEQISNP